MRLRSRRGFTLVELMVAIVILTIGVLSIAGGVMYTTRDLNRSRFATVAAARANAKMDELLTYAAATSPPCRSPRFTSSAAPITVDHLTMSWTVPATGSLRTVQVLVTYLLSDTGERTDTLIASVAC